MTIKFKRVGENQGVELPSYQTEGAAGMDVRSNESLTVQVGQTVLVSTGFAMEIPSGFEAQIRPRSGLAAKHGITLLNSPGTIDHDYRGEVKVILTNLGHSPFEISVGDRIAQMVIARYEKCDIEEVVELSETDRGAGGFGHTGHN
jgi:dUTP pyrophosphatase